MLLWIPLFFSRHIISQNEPRSAQGTHKQRRCSYIIPWVHSPVQLNCCLLYKARIRGLLYTLYSNHHRVQVTQGFNDTILSLSSSHWSRYSPMILINNHHIFMKLDHSNASKQHEFLQIWLVKRNKQHEPWAALNSSVQGWAKIYKHMVKFIDIVVFLPIKTQQRSVKCIDQKRRISAQSPKSFLSMSICGWPPCPLSLSWQMKYAYFLWADISYELITAFYIPVRPCLRSRDTRDREQPVRIAL
jgi:hypothetical protein